METVYVIMITEKIVRKETKWGDAMNRQQVFEWVKDQYGVKPDYPWQDENAVLRHGGNRKWFGVVLEVGRNKLGLEGQEPVDVLNVKCDPAMIGFLRIQPGFHPAYHMNKENWISIRLDGSAPEAEIKNMIDVSYAMTAPKRKTAAVADVGRKKSSRETGPQTGA